MIQSTTASSQRKGEADARQQIIKAKGDYAKEVRTLHGSIRDTFADATSFFDEWDIAFVQGNISK
jgi:hypothetical protein